MSKPRKTTRTGKKLTAEGKVAVPSVKRGEDGKLRATTADEKKAARTTVLPTVKDTSKPVSRVKGRTSVVRGDAPQPKPKGFAVAYPKVKAAVDAARTHLNTMENNEPSSEAHHSAHEAFNAIHANIGKMSPELHTLLGQAKHFVTHPGKGTKELLGMTHDAINNRLALGRMAANANLTRSAEGREGK